MRKQ
jgi:hypothetical protein